MATVSTIETFLVNTTGTGAQTLYTANDPNGTEYLIIDIIVANTEGRAGLIDIRTVTTTYGTQYIERHKVIRSNDESYRVPFKVFSLEDLGVLEAFIDAAPPSWADWTQDTPVFSITFTVVKTVVT